MSAEALQGLLAQARQAMSLGDTASSQRAYAQAHQLAPESDPVLMDLSAACLLNGEVDASLRLARHAISRSGGWRAQLLAAHATQRLQQLDECARHLQLALSDAEMPLATRTSALQQRAQLQLNGFGDASAAALSTRLAAELDPELDLAAELAACVAALYIGEQPRTEIMARFSALGRRLTPPVPASPRHRQARSARLRIGLVSPQFCASPVGFLTIGALTCLARDADLVYFDRGGRADWAQALFRQTASHWHDCAGMGALQLCTAMVDAQLDALIDLGGWTDPVALQALLARPAPRQLKWVGGQAASTGLSCFDGFITDARQVPSAAAGLYTEPLLNARIGYVSYTAPPYASGLAAAAAHPPPPSPPSRKGMVAVAANPAKISALTAERIRALRPRRLVLIDHRWRHEGTRQAASRRLGSLMDVAEFQAPTDHPGYLQALQGLDATFVDTEPYAMGLAAIELRLMGKHIHAMRRPRSALMCERHAVSHLAARRFDHHAGLARQLLQWCGS